MSTRYLYFIKIDERNYYCQPDSYEEQFYGNLYSKTDKITEATPFIDIDAVDKTMRDLKKQNVIAKVLMFKQIKK